MDTADLLHRVLRQGPQAAVPGQVPLRGEIVLRQFDIHGAGVFLALPVPAIAGHHPCAVVGVARHDRLAQRLRRVHHLDVVVHGLEVIVGGIADLQQLVDERQIAVRAAAAELRGEAQLRNLGAQSFRPAPNLRPRAHVFQGDALRLVHEEHRQPRRLHDFLDLMLALVAVQAAFLIQAVRLIHQQRPEAVRRGVHKRPGATEHIADATLLERAGELGLVHRPGRRVPRDVLGGHIAVGKACQQVDGQHGLPGTRASLNDQHLPLTLLRSVSQLQGGLERHLLIVDHNEGVVSLKHG